MSAYTQVVIWCNFDTGHGLCMKRFEGGPTKRVAMAAAREAGWTHVRSQFARSLDEDFCPAHKPGEKP